MFRARKQPVQRTHPWEDRTQAIAAILAAILTITTVIFNLGATRNKLENLESGQREIAADVKKIQENLSTQLYSRDQAEKDLAMRDRLWDARFEAIESKTSAGDRR
jgi:hypothetical protein